MKRVPARKSHLLPGMQPWVYVPTFDQWLRNNAARLGITERP